MSRLLPLLAAFLTISLACSSAEPAGDAAGSAAEKPAEKPTAQSRCTDRELTETWQGEYPGTVVHVQQSVTVPARTDPCSAEPDRQCALLPGLYHPWGDQGKGFATIRPVERLEALKPFTPDAKEYPAGTIVEVYVYFGEGFCGMRIGGETISGECPGINEEGGFRTLRDVSGIPEVELFRAGCTDGGDAWVDVREALAQPAVSEGVFTGYGAVGPAGAEGF